jgi:hypothetical protein
VAKRRGNKEGTVYKRKDGRWCAQVSVNGWRLTRYGKAQGEVREWRKETINQLDQGIAAAAPQTLEEYLFAGLEAVKTSIRPKSCETYERNIRHHINTGLGHIKLRDLRPDHIQRYYTSRLSNGTGVATVRMSHCVLRGALGHAVKWGAAGPECI